MNKLDYALKLIEMLSILLQNQNLSAEEKKELQFISETAKGLRNA